MNYKIFLILTAALIVSTLVVLGCARSSASVQGDASALAAIDNTSRKSAASEKTSVVASTSDDLFNGEKIVKTDDEWRKERRRQLDGREIFRFYGEIPAENAEWKRARHL